MLCDPRDWSDSSVHGILRAWILEWAAIPFSRGSSWPRDQNWVSHIAQILYHLSQQGSPSLFIYHLPIYLCMEWVTHSVDKWALSFTTVVSIYLATLCSSLKALLMFLLHEIILDFTAPVRISTPYSNCPSPLLKGRWSGEWEEVACGDWWHLSSPPAPPLL